MSETNAAADLTVKKQRNKHIIHNPSDEFRVIGTATGPGMGMGRGAGCTNTGPAP